VDQDREPVPDALVAFRFVEARPASDEARTRTSAEVASDAEGRFVAEGLDEGQYLVTATRSGSAPARVDLVPTGTTDLELVLGAGASLEGEVRDAATAAPLAGFSVVVLLRVGELGREPYLSTTVFDAEGRYEIPGLAPGEYDVVATARDYAPSAEQRISIPDPLPEAPVRADFDLGRGGRITGTVVDSVTRRGLEHARVSLEAALGTGPETAVPLRATTTTDAAGRFELGGLSAGLRSIFAAAAGHHRRLISGLAVDEGGNIGPIEIDLRPVREGEEPALELTGIGAVLAIAGDALVVGRVIEGGGAAEAGLVPGDGIVAVDAVPVVELGFEGSIERIRGPEGTTVRLLVRRAGGGQLQVVDVPRRRISA
jgi:hypothetical protein